MAFTTAQLSGAITASQTQFTLTNISANQSGLPTVGALPLPIGNPMVIDSEIMFCYNQPVAGTVQVRGRGSDGSAAAAHDVLAVVSVTATASDFGAIPAQEITTLDPAADIPLTVGQDQTIVIPNANTSYDINKATAIALVLPAPTPQLNGVQLRFTSTTAAAHVITATSLFMDGVGTVPKTTATFAAKQGATLNLIAATGAAGPFWNVISTNGVTIS